MFTATGISTQGFQSLVGIDNPNPNIILVLPQVPFTLVKRYGYLLVRADPSSTGFFVEVVGKSVWMSGTAIAIPQIPLGDSGVEVAAVWRESGISWEVYYDEGL